jgi:hypothetical protein
MGIAGFINVCLFFFQEMKIAVHIIIIWQLATVQMVRKLSLIF